jgi:hypothetical protein
MSHRSAPPLPVSTPAWLTPSRIALAAITAAAASAAIPTIWWIRLVRSEIGNNPSAVRAVAAVTALLSLLLARRAVRSDSVTKAVLWSVSGGILAGVLNAGISCAVVELVNHGDPARAGGNLLAGLFFGGFFGGPLGLAFGLTFAVVLASASRAELDPSHDGPDRVLLTAGIWLVLVGIALGQLAPIAADSPTPVPPLALVAIGLPAAGASILRLQLRKRWLSRVARDLLPEYRIEEPPEDGEIPRHLLPVVRSKQSKSKGILSYCFRDGASPYRDPASTVPLAIADLPPGRARSTKSPRRRKLPATVGPALRSLAADVFITLTKTIGISLILLLFTVALAIPFVSCASVFTMGSSLE